MTVWQTTDMPPEEVAAVLQDIARLLKAQMPAGYGFALMIFSYGDGGTMNYISSAKRADMVKALRELCERLER